MMYERIDVYRRTTTNKVVIYRCWRILPEGGYVVQSADHISSPANAKELVEHEQRLLELFSDVAPEERGEPYPTVEEAIRAFDDEFGGIDDG